MSSAASTIVPGDTNGAQDLFVRDTRAHATVRVDVSSSGRQAKRGAFDEGSAISRGGRFVVFTSASRNLVPGDTNRADDVFIRNLSRGVTRRVSLRPNGSQFFRNSFGDAVAANGRFVLFTARRAGQFEHPYLRDRSRGTTTRLARRIKGDVTAAAMSANGRMIAYLIDGSAPVLLIHDRATGRTIDMLRQPGGHAFADFSEVAFTPTGNKAVFSGLMAQSSGIGLGIWRRGGSVTTIADPPSNMYSPSISDDGTMIAFVSDASNLVAGDTNGQHDVFVHDLLAHTTQRVDLTAAGTQIVQGIDGPLQAALSGDATIAAFSSKDAKVIAGDTNHRTDVFERGPLA